MPKQELEKIVNNMLAGGESEKNISSVINQYKLDNPTILDEVTVTDTKIPNVPLVLAPQPRPDQFKNIPQIQSNIEKRLEPKKDPDFGLSENKKASYEQMRDIKGISQWDEMKNLAQFIATPGAIKNELAGKTDVLDLDESLKIAAVTPLSWVSSLRKAINLKTGVLDKTIEKYGWNPTNWGQLTKEEKEAVEKEVDKQEILNFASGNYGMPGLPNLSFIPPKIAVEAYKNEVQSNLTQYDGDILTSFQKGNIFDAASRILNGSIQTAPTLAAAATGYGGIAVMTSGLYGENFTENYKNNPEQTLGMNILNSGLRAGVEGVGAIVTNKILFNGKIINNIIKPKSTAGKKAVSDMLNGGFNKVTNVLKGMGGEGAEEYITELTADFANEVTNINKFDADQMLENAEGWLNKFPEKAREKVDAAILGAAMGGKTTTIQNIGKTETAVKEHAINLFMSDTDSEFIAKKGEEINKLHEDLDKAETKEGKKIIEQQINDKAQEIAKKRKGIYNNLNNLKEKELIELGTEIDNKNNLIKDLQKETNENVKEEIKKKIKESSKKAKNIFNNATKRRVQESTETARKLIGAKNVKVHTDPNKFQDIYNESTGKNAKESLDVTGVNAFYLNGVMHINKTAAIETNATSVGTHDALHDITKYKLNDSNGKLTPKGRKLIDDFREQLSAKEIKVVEQRINDNYKFDEDGNERPYEDYAEEYLNVFHDAVVKGDIKYNPLDAQWWKDLANSFTTMFKEEGFENINFENGKDAYDFMRRYNKATKDESIEDLKRLSTELKKQGRELDVQIANEKDPRKLAELRKQREELSKKVRETVAAENAKLSDTREANFENKIQKLWEEQKFDELLEAYKPRVRKILESEYKNYLESNNITPGTQRYNEVVDEVLTGKRGILETVMKYDTKLNVPLSGYVGSILNKRGISEQVFAQVPDTDGQYKQAIDSQTDKVADEVIEEITESKKELLKETINLDPGILNEVVQAVTKTFGTNLGDITSPQFKQKLQDNFKLQLQKTIKNMLGTRGDYQTYLKNNWESIWNSIPQSVVNKSFPELNEKVLTKDGKQAREKTKAGKPLFKKKKLTEKQFMDYFNPPAVNPKTGKRSGLAGTRKDGLANAIAQTLALDEVMDVLSIPEVASKFEEINKVLNLKLPNNWKAYVQKAIDNIDTAIADINSPDTILSGPPKQIITSFYNALKGFLKGGATILDAISKAYDSVIAKWLKSSNVSPADIADIKSDLLYKLRNLDQTSENFQEQIQEITNALEEISPQEKVEDRNFLKELRKLNDPELNAILDDKRSYQMSYKEDGVRKTNIDITDKLAEQSNKILKQLPLPVHNIFRKLFKDSAMYAMFGQKNRALEASAKNKGEPGNYYDLFVGEDAPFNSAKSIDNAVKDGEISKELGKLLKEIDFDKIQTQNLGKLNDGDLLSDILDIIKSDLPAREKQQKINEIYDGEVGANNIKLAKAMVMFFKEQYNKGNIDKPYLVSILQGQTSIVESFRSLTDIGAFYLEDGPQDISAWKGEHVKPNSETMSEIYDFITNKNSTENDIDAILEDHSQTFGPKEIMDGKIDKSLPKTSPLRYRRFFILSEGQRSKFYIPSTGMNINEKVVVDELLKENKESAEKVNQETFGDMDAETRKNWDKARELARDPNQPQKGITIVDFDDTLATSNSKVIVNMPDGTTKKITPAEFAKQHAALELEGAKFDFSEFNKVIGGKPGPFFNKVKKLAEKFGTEQIHILTARPQASAAAIQAFMKGLGIDINIDNIVGLEDGRPEAKRDFIIKKAAEGFNDFLFADDVTANTKAVQQALDALDIKSDIRTEDKNFKRDLNLEFNKIIEQNKGLDRNAVVSEARAKSKGAKRGNWFTNFFLAPSSEDFAGLLYTLLGKGKKGEQQWAFLKKALIDPFARGIRDLNAFKQVLANELKALKDLYPEVTKSLRKNSGVGDYNNAHAIRVYNWNKAGYTAADLGISQTDFNNLIKVVEANNDMKAFADGVRPITKVEEGYPPPKDSWIIGNIDTDMQDVGNTAKRSEFLKEFNDNVEQIFTPENIRKLELIYGSKFTEALDDMLYRMQYGTNRSQGSSRIVNQWQNWVNNSVGAIMFFNMRSAFLQTLSSVNFMNWSDNNPLMAAKAFANQKQFWKDFSFIFNHPTLKQRRAGLDIDVNASEIAKRVQESNNPVSAALSYLLQIGFTPTRIADSFAIAIGGASMYRNRINTYKKKGLSDAEAADKAFLDFQEISEATQQSARPDMISQQQASVLGRLILAFQVTPMQYARLIKRSIQDLAAGRGDRKTHISKILYYGAAQNILFNSLQSALFALAYGTDDEEEDEKLTDKEKRKLTRIANNSVDTLLRGLGVQGAAVATIKNMVIKFLEQEKRGYRADHAYTLIEGLNISPPIGSKARKVYGGTQSYKFNREAIKEMGLDIDNPAYDAVSNIVSGTTNLPLDRVLANINNLRGAIDKRNQAWQRIALLMGWNTWDVEVPNRDLQKAKEDIKKRKAEERRKKKKK